MEEYRTIHTGRLFGTLPDQSWHIETCHSGIIPLQKDQVLRTVCLQLGHNCVSNSKTAVAGLVYGCEKSFTLKDLRAESPFIILYDYAYYLPHL